MISALLTTAFCLHIPNITTFLLGLAGMELPFIIAACMVLCFVFAAKPVLVAQQSFGYC